MHGFEKVLARVAGLIQEVILVLAEFNLAQILKDHLPQINGRAPARLLHLDFSEVVAVVAVAEDVDFVGFELGIDEELELGEGDEGLFILYDHFDWVERKLLAFPSPIFPKNML